MLDSSGKVTEIEKTLTCIRIDGFPFNAEAERLVLGQSNPLLACHVVHFGRQVSQDVGTFMGVRQRIVAQTQDSLVRLALRRQI